MQNLDKLFRELQKEGVKIVGEKEEYEYGKFGWIFKPFNYGLKLTVGKRTFAIPAFKQRL